jgi:hypothetical protein
MDWRVSDEASLLWEGYAWSSRITVPLLEDFKLLLLDTMAHTAELPTDAARNLRMMFTHVAITSDVFTASEQRSALGGLTTSGLQDVVFEVLNMLREGERGEALWEQSLLSWFRAVWPKDVQHRSPELSSELAVTVTFAGETFPAAVRAVTPLLVTSDDCDILLDRLVEREYWKSHPESVLALLVAIVDPAVPGVRHQLGDLLEKLKGARPEIARLPRFRRLEAAV